MDLLLTVALMYGLTFAAKDSTLLSPPRDWISSRSDFFREMLSCAFCTGFHSGWISFLLLRSAGVTTLPWAQGLFIYAFVGATVSYTLDLLLLALEDSD